MSRDRTGGGPRLVYVLVIEQLAIGLPLAQPISEALSATLIGPNALGLSQHFGDLTIVGSGLDPVASGQAAAVLIAYLAGFLLLAGVIFERREIT